jgi:hypothetical protein
VLNLSTGIDKVWYDDCMRKRLSNEQGQEDINGIAFRITSQAIGKLPKDESDGKNPAAVALGRLGGLKGGKARAIRLSAERRSEIAQQAARKRWQNHESSEG